MSSFEPLTTLKLSIQRALLGEVSSRLVSVTCGLKEKQIHIKAYFSGGVTQEDIERIQIIGAEVIADFPEEYSIEESCLPVVREEEMLDFWAFRRSEEAS